MKGYICVRCNKTLASPQSLWNHHQRCRDNITKYKTSVNGFPIKPRIDSTSAHKEKLLADIINNTQRAKDGRNTSILPIKPVNSVVPKQEISKDLKPELKSESTHELDSEDPLTTLDSDSEENTDTEFSEDDRSMTDNLEELKAAFRNLYQKVHNNMKNYNKLILILDEFYRINHLTKEECNALNSHLQKKIGNA